MYTDVDCGKFEILSFSSKDPALKAYPGVVADPYIWEGLPTSRGTMSGMVLGRTKTPFRGSRREARTLPASITYLRL